MENNKPRQLNGLDEVKADAAYNFNSRIRELEEKEKHEAAKEGREPRAIIPPVYLPEKPAAARTPKE